MAQQTQFSQHASRDIFELDSVSSLAKLSNFFVKGSQTRESTIQNQEEGPAVTNSQTAPPIPVPAIIKVGQAFSPNIVCKYY